MGLWGLSMIDSVYRAQMGILWLILAVIASGIVGLVHPRAGFGVAVVLGFVMLLLGGPGG